MPDALSLCLMAIVQALPLRPDKRVLDGGDPLREIPLRD